jgi:glycosyltransferase involved in cell wall biosynthesis
MSCWPNLLINSWRPRLKKILIITDNLQDQINGVVTTFTNLEACAVLDHYQFVYIDPGQFTHFDCPGYNEIKIALAWKIGQKIQALDPDHIHIATEGPLGLAARCWLDRRGWRYNTSYHTRFPEALNKILGVPESWSWRYMRWFHKHSGRVLTTTDSMVADLRSHGFVGDIRPWTRGVDRTVFQPRCDANTAESEPVLLCVSRISKEKNLEAFCSLDIPGTRKVMVGDGPERNRLEALYPDVEFVGFKIGAELAQCYRDADVFVFPSRWDTFGIVMIEAMACGTPVAAYPVTGPLDVIEPGVTGFMDHDLASAVQQCLQLNRNQVAEGSERWSWQRCWHIFRDNLVDIV